MNQGVVHLAATAQQLIPHVSMAILNCLGKPDLQCISSTVELLAPPGRLE
jgi:hypothetical protein